MKVLITGITGFAGSHLAEYLLKLGKIEVIGTKRWRSRMENIHHIRDKIKFVECDLRDYPSMIRAIEETTPDRIFHLAAQSFVPTSWIVPSDTITTNINGNLYLFEACREVGINPRIQIACSSEEYGMVFENEVPIKEMNPLRPLSPYGVSKVGQDMLSYQYYQSYKMHIVRTRGFNHTGPRRGSVFVCSDFARQIVEIEKGMRKPIIYVGNLDAVRDFTDVRDMIRGYWIALDKGDPGEVYNISTKKGYKIKEVLDILLSMSKTKIEIREDESRLRPSDVPLLVGDNSKFVKKTDWQPEIPFEKTLEDILDYWRSRTEGVLLGYENNR